MQSSRQVGALAGARTVVTGVSAGIGAEIGVSQMQVSRRLRAILNQLQLALTPWAETGDRAG